MNQTDPKQVAKFVIILAVIALLINSCQDFGVGQRFASATVAQQPQQQPDTGAAAARQAAQDAAAEHARYLARYLNTGFARTPGTEAVAVAVASEDGKLNRTLSEALARRFNGEGITVFSSFFKPEFVSDGLFDVAFSGSAELFNKLELANSLDALLLARQTVQYSTNDASLNNVITANMRLEVVVMPVAGNGQSQTWKFTANGAGFKPEDARAMAEDRLVKQIAADTKMSLAQISPNK